MVAGMAGEPRTRLRLREIMAEAGRGVGPVFGNWPVLVVGAPLTFALGCLVYLVFSGWDWDAVKDEALVFVAYGVGGVLLAAAAVYLVNLLQAPRRIWRKRAVAAEAALAVRAGATPPVAQPDWALKDLFFYLDPDVLSGPRESDVGERWEVVGRTIMDQWSLGALFAWGRRGLTQDIDRLAPLQTIPDDFWTSGPRFTYDFFARSDRADLRSGNGDEWYGDVRVSNSQARALWPSGGVSNATSDRRLTDWQRQKLVTTLRSLQWFADRVQLRYSIGSEDSLKYAVQIGAAFTDAGWSGSPHTILDEGGPHLTGLVVLVRDTTKLPPAAKQLSEALEIASISFGWLENEGMQDRDVCLSVYRKG